MKERNWLCLRVCGMCMCKGIKGALANRTCLGVHVYERAVGIPYKHIQLPYEWHL